MLGAPCSYSAPPAELYRLLLEAQNGNKAADGKMIDCMTRLSDTLSRYHRRFKKFPESASELEDFDASARLSKIKNPYSENELLAKELPANSPQYVQYQLLPDYGLSRNGTDALAKRPPKSWTGPPGTISIMHNSENLFAVRACGLDGKPIIDHTTNSVIFVFRDLSQ
jgi:hypothetical protein